MNRTTATKKTTTFSPILTCRSLPNRRAPSQYHRAQDARRKKTRGQPRIARATEEFERSLSKIGEHIGHLIEAFPAGTRDPELTATLERYALALRPWAKRASQKMIADVNARDLEAWRAIASTLHRQLTSEIQSSQVGAVMARLAAEQTELIASLPLEAARRVQRLTVTGLIEGEQLARLTREIERSGEVSAAHARLIARTETSRTASNLTQARAELAGLPLYRWHTSQDDRVRPGHADMEGQVCEWANPPAVIENGVEMHFHPGTIWNCRCWAVPIT